MEFNRRLESFLKLKSKLKMLSETELEPVIAKAKMKNRWFTDDNIKYALDGIIYMLDETKLKSWTDRYDMKNIESKAVGVVMAGNIPLVGFHDLLCVLLSGHKLIAKLSSQDDVLLPFIAGLLIDIEPEWRESISFVEKLEKFDAVIATGSDNTSRYFEYYFKNYPRIVRKNRISVAVLNGKESNEELKKLGEDIYTYFGLGCRNVSKIFIPSGFDIKTLLDQLNHWAFLGDSNKYVNNYNYNRAIYAMEQISFLDNGFSIYRETDQLVSPTAVIYYQTYDSLEEIRTLLAANREKIQCIVAQESLQLQSIPFGKAQHPEVWDYADNVDTMEFLLGLRPN